MSAVKPGLVGALLTALVVGMVGCGMNEGGTEAVESGVATQQLEQQRDDVRKAARSLLVAAEEALPGLTANSVGGYDGCESAFNDEFKNFRYLAQARIDVDPASDTAAPYLEPLGPVLEEAGFTVGEPEEASNGFVTLTGEKGDVTASFVHTAAGAFVGLDVHGPCVDVPEDDRDDWLTRDEPTPEIR